MMYNRIRIVLAIFLVISTSAFSQIAVSLNDFTKVEVFGRINVRLEKSTSDSLLIESGSFDVEKVHYSIDDKVLKIKLLSEFPPSIKVNVTVKFQQIQALKAGGGANIYNRGLIESKVFVLEAKSGCELDLFVDIDSAIVRVNKGAFVRLTGENRYLLLKTSTGGDFRSTKMPGSEVYAIMNGGTAEVDVKEFLTAIVRYGASLKFVDQPKKIKKKERFGGKIDKLEDF